MPNDLDCTPDVQNALKFINLGQVEIAIAHLSKRKGCHLRHPTCPYTGEDCAVQDLIEGFFGETTETA